ncbi:unnamed protein product [Nezara viridula]|uniref:AAA+ ATPase domain-containing protein n=1 Tax=Nezara viridula TaxID=85310 RepID=A0A9P0DVM2_NEZVI|nr:unnamed protein product [Nezara viridula]
MSNSTKNSFCPVCNKEFPIESIENHVEKCLFLNSECETTLKRQYQEDLPKSPILSNKKIKNSSIREVQASTSGTDNNPTTSINTAHHGKKILKDNQTSVKPLAERVRPDSLQHLIGQSHILGDSSVLKNLVENYDFPSMILWGPPGCGKTSLANVIQKMCQEKNNYRFVKLSATSSGVNDIKELVQVSKNELNSFKRKTVLFMDEIHRFNKLQQDIFLPTVESGLITLIGATTENPSFTLNNALLSRCRVFVFEKLKVDDIFAILVNATPYIDLGIIDGSHNIQDNKFKFLIEKETITWLAEMSDGDARIALNSLQMAVSSKSVKEGNSSLISLDDIKNGIKRSHLLYDRKGEEHYNMISALHKSIRASDDNASLYWLTRMLEGGEDPMFIARRLVRAASEDVGLSDPMALTLAVSAMQGCQMIGMPECDVILAQAVVYLARTYKSQEVYRALVKSKDLIKNFKGPQPTVPLHLRNAPTKLMRDLGYAQGYNLLHRDESNLTYMPEGMESMSFFREQ